MLPTRLPSFCSTSLVKPAKTGDDRLVPPMQHSITGPPSSLPLKAPGEEGLASSEMSGTSRWRSAGAHSRRQRARVRRAQAKTDANDRTVVVVDRLGDRIVDRAVVGIAVVTQVIADWSAGSACVRPFEIEQCLDLVVILPRIREVA